MSKYNRIFCGRNGITIITGNRVKSISTGFRGIFSGYNAIDDSVKVYECGTMEPHTFTSDDIVKDLDAYLEVDFYALTPDGPDYIDTVVDVSPHNMAEVSLYADTLGNFPGEWSGFHIIWVWDPALWSGRILYGL